MVLHLTSPRTGLVVLCLLQIVLLCNHPFKFAKAIKVVTTSNNPYQYHVEDDDTTVVFHGGDVAFFIHGRWCVQREVNNNNNNSIPTWILKYREIRSISGTEDVLGDFTGERVKWSCLVNPTDATNRTQNTTTVVPITTCYKNFENAVLLDVIWPKGALNTSVVVGSSDSAMTNFPSLTTAASTLPNALSWQGSFTQSVRGFSKGTQGGPTVFYNGADPALETVIVASPYGTGGYWKSYSSGDGQNWKGEACYWSPGTSGLIEELPPNYTQSILLYQGSSSGITGTMDAWGQVMQQRAKESFPKLPDITLEKIGYQTDNGAMYCFCSDHNCSETLLKELDYLQSIEVPMGYLSFQGAGASSGRGKAAPWCVDTWGVDGGLGKQYPMNLSSFQAAVGLPFQLYAPYFCPDSPYFSVNESQWQSIPSDPTIPGCDGFAFENVQPDQSRAFYDWFFQKGIQHAGMTSFESDFMNQNYKCVPEFIHNATAATIWQQGMATAAYAQNITIQWCYAAPSDILASLDMPSVTNFRVSFDFCYGHSWNIGESSLLVWALGAVPSKDTLWSTDNNRTATPGCPWTPDHEVSAAELHVVLALMSNGPVGLSDAIHNTNATLLKRIMMKDGTLLKPSKPITAIDSTFLEESYPILASPGRDDGGYVYGTSGAAEGLSWIFVSFLLPEGFEVKMRDLWPRPILNARQQINLVYRHFGNGSSSTECEDGQDAVSSGCVQLAFVSNEPIASVFQAPAAPNATMVAEEQQLSYSPTVTTVWQPCPKSGWIMLGELDKYVSLSPKRFQLECTDEGISVSVTGAPGEVVELTALRPTDNTDAAFYTVFKKTVYIPEGSDGSSLQFELTAKDDMDNVGGESKLQISTT